MVSIETKKNNNSNDAEELVEVEISAQSKGLGSLHKIDLEEDEVWLLQCPKGMDLKTFEEKQIKLPGRTSLREYEAVSTEFTSGPIHNNFAFCRPKKQKYSVRVLPVRGTIIVRDHLVNEAELQSAVTVPENVPEILRGEDQETVSRNYIKKLPNPNLIPVRHPLLGHNFQECLDKIRPSVGKRLLKASIKSERIVKKTAERVTGWKIDESPNLENRKDRLRTSVANESNVYVKKEPVWDSDPETSLPPKRKRLHN